MNTDIPQITLTAPLRGGKREQNYAYLNQFSTPSQVTQIKSSFSKPISNRNLPTNPAVRKPEFKPFRSKNLEHEIKNLVEPESTKLFFAIIFFILSLICLASFLLEFHPEISLLLSILFFGFWAYPFSKFILRKRKKDEEKNANKINMNLTPPRLSRNNNIKPSQMFAIYGSTNQIKTPEFYSDASVDLYPKFVNADRPTASKSSVSSITRTLEAQTDSHANDTLKKLGLKLQIFNQYTSNMKNFIQKDILSKIVKNLSSDKPYIDMMLSVPNYDQKHVIQRITYLASSPYLAGHTGEKGDNQIVLHILSVWLSYLMTHSKEDKLTSPVFSQKYLAIGGTEPKIQSDNDVYIVANNQYNSFYIITRPFDSLKKGNLIEASNVERFYARPGKDMMYSTLTLFFLIIKKKFEFLLDGADLQEPPFCMHRIFELSHL